MAARTELQGETYVRPAFEDWYRSDTPRLRATLSCLLRDPVVADEVLSEACARAYARWSSIERNPAGWVYRTAVRDYQRQLRRNRKERALRSALSGPPPAFEADSTLWALVDELPPRMKLAIVLRYVADLSEEQVSSAMGLSRGGASSLLVKARRTLEAGLTAPADANRVEQRGGGKQ